MSTRQKNASLMQYREAALYEGTKEWFVYYYAHDPASKELKRKKIKLNHIKNIRDRRAAANRIIKTINKKLSTGWSPFVTVGAEKCYAFVFVSLFEGFSNALIRKNDAKDIDFNTVFITNMALSFVLFAIMFLCGIY